MRPIRYASLTAVPGTRYSLLTRKGEPLFAVIDTPKQCFLPHESLSPSDRLRDSTLTDASAYYVHPLSYASRAESSLNGKFGVNRRPRSTPAGVRAGEEAASTVFDRRPPWSLALDSVFAPRVAGAVQVTGFVVCSASRGKILG